MAASQAPKWIAGCISSYVLVTLLAQECCHAPQALQQLRQQVPTQVHDRASFMLAATLALDILHILFTGRSSRLSLILPAAFMKAVTLCTTLLLRFGEPVVLFTAAGRTLVLQRYICWMNSTATILMLLQQISASITDKELITAIIWDEAVLIGGVLTLLTRGWLQLLLGVATHAAALPLLPYMAKSFREAAASSDSPSVKRTMHASYYVTVAVFASFGVVWGLALFNLVSPLSEEILFLACDLFAKAMFSSTLMLNGFLEKDARQQTAMRQIEGAGKQHVVDELRQLLAQKQRFMSSVSHELRTPLQGIIGICEGLLVGRCGMLPEEARRQMYTVRSAGQRLLAVVNDVLDATAMQQTGLVLKNAEVLLKDLVDDVLDLMRPIATAGVELRNTVPPHIIILADQGRIVQVLNSLLSNAVKFTQQGVVRVSARPCAGGSQVAVTVSDTGIGIPRQNLAAIFQPFEQIMNSRGGVGLGLSLAHEIVKAHGGEMWAESVEGRGSVFTMILPSAGSASQQQEPGPAAAAAAAGATPGGGIMRQPSHGAWNATMAGPVSAAGAAVGTAGEAGEGHALDSQVRGAVVVPVPRPRRAGRGLLQPLTGGSWAEAALEAISRAFGSEPGPRPPLRPTLQCSAAASGTAALPAALHAANNSFPGARQQAVPARVMLASAPGTRPTAPPEYRAPLSGLRQRRSVLPTVALASTSGSPHAAPAPAAPTAAASPRRSSRRASAAQTAPAGTSAQGDAGTGPSAAEEIGEVQPQRPFYSAVHGRFQVMSVDSDMVNQSVLRVLLGAAGYQLLPLLTGEQALGYLTTCSELPDCVLLDCVLPGLDGFQVLRRMRSAMPDLHIPVILVSPQPDEHNIIKGLDLGADDVVNKPYRRQELLARLQGQLGMTRQHEGEEGSHTSPLKPLDPTAAAGSGALLLDGAPPSGRLPHANSSVPDFIGARGDAKQGEQSRRLAGGHRLTVLSIDDDETSQAVLEGILKTQGYRFIKCGTAEEAITQLLTSSRAPDLLLLNCMLPDSTGVEACQRIHAMFPKTQFPIIMLSSQGHEQSIIDSLDQGGADDYIAKPVRRGELLARISMHLRMRGMPPGGPPDLMPATAAVAVQPTSRGYAPTPHATSGPEPGPASGASRGANTGDRRLEAQRGLSLGSSTGREGDHPHHDGGRTTPNPPLVMAGVARRLSNLTAASNSAPAPTSTSIDGRSSARSSAHAATAPDIRLNMWGSGHGSGHGSEATSTTAARRSVSLDIVLDAMLTASYSSGIHWAQGAEDEPEASMAGAVGRAPHARPTPEEVMAQQARLAASPPFVPPTAALQGPAGPAVREGLASPGRRMPPSMARRSFAAATPLMSVNEQVPLQDDAFLAPLGVSAPPPTAASSRRQASPTLAVASRRMHAPWEGAGAGAGAVPFLTSAERRQALIASMSHSSPQRPHYPHSGDHKSHATAVLMTSMSHTSPPGRKVLHLATGGPTGPTGGTAAVRSSGAVHEPSLRQAQTGGEGGGNQAVQQQRVPMSPAVQQHLARAVLVVAPQGKGLVRGVQPGVGSREIEAVLDAPSAALSTTEPAAPSQQQQQQQQQQMMMTTTTTTAKQGNSSNINGPVTIPKSESPTVSPSGAGEGAAAATPSFLLPSGHRRSIDKPLQVVKRLASHTSSWRSLSIPTAPASSEIVAAPAHAVGFAQQAPGASGVGGTSSSADAASLNSGGSPAHGGVIPTLQAAASRLAAPSPVLMHQSHSARQSGSGTTSGAGTHTSGSVFQSGSMHNSSQGGSQGGSQGSRQRHSARAREVTVEEYLETLPLAAVREAVEGVHSADRPASGPPTGNVCSRSSSTSASKPIQGSVASAAAPHGALGAPAGPSVPSVPAPPLQPVRSRSKLELLFAPRSVSRVRSSSAIAEQGEGQEAGGPSGSGGGGAPPAAGGGKAKGMSLKRLFSSLTPKKKKG